MGEVEAVKIPTIDVERRVVKVTIKIPLEDMSKLQAILSWGIDWHNSHPEIGKWAKEFYGVITKTLNDELDFLPSFSSDESKLPIFRKG